MAALRGWKTGYCFMNGQKNTLCNAFSYQPLPTAPVSTGAFYSAKKEGLFSLIPLRGVLQRKPTACSACVFLFSVCLRKRAFDAFVKQKNRNSRFGFSSRRKRDYSMIPKRGVLQIKTSRLSALVFFCFLSAYESELATLP